MHLIHWPDFKLAERLKHSEAKQNTVAIVAPLLVNVQKGQVITYKQVRSGSHTTWADAIKSHKS